MVEPMQPQPQYKQQYMVQKEKGSVFKGMMKAIVFIIIIVLIAGLCYGVWQLIKFAMDKGYLF